MKDTLGAFCPDGIMQLEGAPEGPLAGVTFAAKDLFDVAGHRTGAGNPDFLAKAHPAKSHAFAVKAMLDAGATLVGKTITDELAFGLAGENFHYGTPLNSAAPDRIPGGSSSGIGLRRCGRCLRYRAGDGHRRVGARTFKPLRHLRHPHDTRANSGERSRTARRQFRHGWLVRT